VKSGMTPAAAIVLAATTLDRRDLGNGNAILNAAQLARAAQFMAKLSPQDRAALNTVLAAAQSPGEEAYILKALAAGHPVADVPNFATAIHGKGPDWLQGHLSLVNPDRPSKQVGYFADGQMWFLKQQDPTSCGPTAVIVARATNDPMYALGLTTD